MKWKKRARSLFALLLIGCLLLAAAGCGTASSDTTSSDSSVSVTEDVGTLEVTFLKVGKADAIVLIQDGHAMVIDCGEEDDGDEIVETLQSNGISKVETLIITHFDKDHVGGAATLIESMEVEQVLLPDYESTSEEYLNFLSAMETAGITPTRLTESLELALGTASVLVEPPLSYDVTDEEGEVDNNLSLITTVTHGDNTLLFMGDAEKQRIQEWLGVHASFDVDLLKLPHHGVYNKALKTLLAAVSPEWTIICCSEKNPPEDKTTALLAETDTQVLLTDTEDVIIISDGNSLIEK